MEMGPCLSVGRRPLVPGVLCLAWSRCLPCLRPLPSLPPGRAQAAAMAPVRLAFLERAPFLKVAALGWKDRKPASLPGRLFSLGKWTN